MKDEITLKNEANVESIAKLLNNAQDSVEQSQQAVERMEEILDNY